MFTDPANKVSTGCKCDRSIYIFFSNNECGKNMLPLPGTYVLRETVLSRVIYFELIGGGICLVISLFILQLS